VLCRHHTDWAVVIQSQRLRSLTHRFLSRTAGTMKSPLRLAYSSIRVWRASMSAKQNGKIVDWFVLHRTCVPTAASALDKPSAY
jgi:hypothetical protein